ncbi:MAG: hypothetical protein AAB441_04390 [Patescibacteria group bacterium]
MFDQSEDMDYYEEIIIDGVSQKIIEQGSDQRLSIKQIEQLIGEVVDGPTGLPVFLVSQLIWRLPIDSDSREKIKAMRIDLLKKDKLFANLVLSEQILLNNVERFCDKEFDQPIYSQIENGKTQSENQVLSFMCQQIAAHYQEKNKNWVIQSYLHPTRSVPGIWMSQTGKHFEPEDFLSIEAGIKKRFARTYLPAAGQKAVGKIISVQ